MRRRRTSARSATTRPRSRASRPSSPSIPKSPLAHRAQYWIGDSQYNLRDFKNAIVSQQKLIANYSDSASVPDALLNIASSQSELGEAAAARKTLEGLVTRYPASDAAEKARRRLATIK